MTTIIDSIRAEFLTTDGEKPWRHREEEFAVRTVSRAELLSTWEQGWAVLLDALANLKDEQLQSTVTIRRQPLLVHEALHRSLGHLAYHVGQIVYLAKMLRGQAWRYLSIPPGLSDAYNAAPTRERPAAHAEALAFRSPTDRRPSRDRNGRRECERQLTLCGYRRRIAVGAENGCCAGTGAHGAATGRAASTAGDAADDRADSGANAKLSRRPCPCSTSRPV